MAKSISHRAFDAALDYIASRADTLVLLEGAPIEAEEALTAAGEGGRMLSLAALTPGLGNGDFAIMPGLVSGRRLVIAAREGLAIVASGIADHVALVSGKSSEVLVVTPLAEPCELTAGSFVSVAAFSEEIADPL